MEKLVFSLLGRCKRDFDMGLLEHTKDEKDRWGHGKPRTRRRSSTTASTEKAAGDNCIPAEFYGALGESRADRWRKWWLRAARETTARSGSCPSSRSYRNEGRSQWPHQLASYHAPWRAPENHELSCRNSCKICQQLPRNSRNSTGWSRPSPSIGLKIIAKPQSSQVIISVCSIPYVKETFVSRSSNGSDKEK